MASMPFAQACRSRLMCGFAAIAAIARGVRQFARPPVLRTGPRSHVIG
jgi:hypothetical protein